VTRDADGQVVNRCVSDVQSHVVGAGTPLFEGKPDVALQPIDTQTWDHSASILVRYEVRHNGA
jgi:hypothetical protein